MEAALSFEEFVKRYFSASEARKRAALAAAITALDGADPVTEHGRCLSITEAAQRAGVSRTLIYRAIHMGALKAPPLYQGGNRRIRESDFRHWMNRC
jgi:excisionase family DNA binding protein